MLQNRQDKRNNRSIQLPRQAEAPNLKQIEYLFEQCSAQSNMGRAIELPFGPDVSFGWLLTVTRHHNQDAQWMFYRMGQSGSALEWSQMTNDPNMIASAICAQFPEVDLSVKGGSTGMSVPILFHSEGETSEPAQQINQVQAKPKAKAVMEGDLEHLQPVNLLHSVAVAKMSGRLEITGETDTANVFFVEGNPTHCVLRGAEGDAAILELISWESGLYRFYHEVPPREQTVHKRLDVMLQEGAQLNEQYKVLTKNGLRLESYLMRSNQNISERSFEQAAMAQGAAVDLGLQKAIYQAIDNSSTLFELLRRLALTKQDWVPALFNMLNCQLIGFTNTPPAAALPVVASEKHIVPTPVDWTAVRQSDRSLYRADTGAMTVPAFLGFLEREQARFEVTHRPYALVVIELGVCGQDGALEPLSNQGVREIVSHIEGLKRKCDVIGHFETFGIGLILPETGNASAKNFACSLADALLARKSKEGGQRMVLNLGVGSIPEDCQRLEELLTVARPSR